MKKSVRARRFRVSCFELPDAKLESPPVKHHACKTEERARKLFATYVGKFGSVVLHQGNLKHSSYLVIERHPKREYESGSSYLDTLIQNAGFAGTFLDFASKPLPPLDLTKDAHLHLRNAYNGFQRGIIRQR